MNYFIDWQNTVAWIATLLLILIGLLILWKRSKVEYAVAYSLFSIFAGLWSFGIFGFRGAILVQEKWFYIGWLYFSGAVLVPFFLHFCLLYPDKKRKLGISTKLLIYLPLAIIGYLLFPTSQLPVISGLSASGISTDATIGKGYWVYALWFILYISIAFLFLVRKYINSVGFEKRQVGYVLWAAAIPFSAGLYFDLILPWMGNYQQIHWGTVLVMANVGFISYAILKYRFLDFEIVFKKGFIYSLLTLLLFSSYLILYEFFRVGVDDGSRFYLYFFALAATSLMLLLPLINLIEKVSVYLTRQLHQKQYREVVDFIEEISSAETSNTAVRRLEQVLVQCFRLNSVSIWRLGVGNHKPLVLHQGEHTSINTELVAEGQNRLIDSKMEFLEIYEKDSNFSIGTLLFSIHAVQSQSFLLVAIADPEDPRLKEYELSMLKSALQAFGKAYPSLKSREEELDLVALKNRNLAQLNEELTMALNNEPTTENKETGISKDASNISIPDLKVISNLIRNFDHPKMVDLEALAKCTLFDFKKGDQPVPDSEICRNIMGELVEYFRPDDQSEKRTRHRLKYEILRMMAYEGATEEQMMWDLGFDTDFDPWLKNNEEKSREPRYPYRGKGDYAATSRASFKRLKSQAIEDARWRLEELERRVQSF